MVWGFIYEYFYGKQKRLKKEKYKLWYEENYNEMKNLVLGLLEGRDVPLDENHIRRLESIPKWVDRENIEKGQQLARDYVFVTSLAEMISIYLLLLVDNILRPLIYTNRSSTVMTALKRYLSTILRVLSWYDYDLLDEESEARKNINAVNQLHCSVLAHMSSKTEGEIRRQSQLKNRLKEDLWSPSCIYIRKDLVEMARTETMDIEDAMGSKNYINQYTMALTQYAFMGLLVLYPEKLGLVVSRDKLEAFIHLWRYIGYLTGIEDKYNICIGSYDEVIFKCKAVTELIFKPNLARASQEWEHMSHAVCEGMNKILDQLVFQSTVVILLDVYDLNSNEYFKKLSWRAKYKYYYYQFLTYLMPFKYFRNSTNNFIRSKLMLAKEKLSLG